MNNNLIPNYKTLTRIPLFRRTVLQSFPFIEEDFDALTDYELLCKVVEYLNNVIRQQNLVGENTDELLRVYLELKKYVESYLNDETLQPLINNKLDEMVEQGTLQEIIAEYLNSKAIFGYDNVSDMKSATNLINGSYAQTLGYHTKNDGGKALYKIRTITNNDVVDEMLIVALNNNTLVAELIENNIINIKQLGAYGDNTHDDTNTFKTFSTSNIKKLIIPEGTYKLTDVLDFTNKEIIGINNPSLNYSSQTTSREHYIMLHNYFYIENITFNQLVHNTDVIGIFDCSYSEFKNCKFIADGYKCGSELDFYTNNHDIVVNDCYFKLKSYDSENVIQEGGIWIREHIANKESYNITFNNCVVSHDSKDEIIASWNWVGTVHDVILNNCKLIGETTNTAPWFITFNTENSSINNCYIENKITSNFSGMFKNNETIDYNNININNCYIKQYSSMTNGFCIFKANFNNCNIVNNTTKELFGSKATFNSCYFDLKQFVCNGGYYNNCKFKGDGTTLTGNVFTLNGPTNLYLLNCLFENYVFTNGMFIYTFNNCDNIIIKNTKFDIDISGLTYFLFGSNDITKLEVTDSNIEKGFYTTGTVGGYIANNITNITISAFSNVKVNNNFNVTA